MADTDTPPPPPGSSLPPDILAQIKANPSVRNLLATMMVREAGGEGPRGMQDVMDVALNRARESGQSLQDVIMTPDAFTSMTFQGLGGNRNVKPLTPAELQRAYSVIDKPNPEWDLPPTADAFNNPALQARFHQMDPAHYKAQPGWLQGKNPVAQYGRHQFYATGYKGGGKPEQPGPDQGQTDASALDPNSLIDPKAKAALDANIAAEQANLPAVIQSIRDKAIYQTQVGQRVQAMIDKNQELSDRMMASTDALMKDMPDEYKMRQQELAKVSDQPMDPTRVLGEMLPMIAVMGGAFTKAGVTGSLNAAAAAMQAAKGNDEAAMKRAHDDFQDQLTQVMDKATIVHQAISEALANNRNNTQDALTAAQLVGAQYDIPGLTQAAYSGAIKDVMQVNDMGTKAISTLLGLQLKAATLEQKENGKPTPYMNTDTGAVDYMHVKADGSVSWTDKDNNPVDGPAHFSHITSGRLYGGLSGAIQAAQEDKERGGGGAMTEQDILKVTRDYYTNESSAKAFASGPLGNQIQAFNTGIAHLDTLSQLGDALKNGDTPMINALSQAIAEQTGQAAPTNFDAVKRIVGQEVNKAIVAGGGGQNEREEAAAVFDRAKAPEQLAGAIKQVETLMTSQLESLRTRYVGGGGNAQDFSDKFLTSRTQELLGGAASQGLVGEERKGAWAGDVKGGREMIRSKKMKAAAVRAALAEEYPDASPQQLDAAVDMNAH